MRHIGEKNLKKFLDRRAVSNAISAVILTGATIALGLTSLFWSQSMAADYVRGYGETIDADIARLKERLAVEYIYYNNDTKNVTIYLLNCGAVHDIKIASVYIRSDSKSWAFSDPNINPVNGNGDQDLDIGEEGYIVLALPETLTTGVYHHVRIVTVRGAIFDSGFVV